MSGQSPRAAAELPSRRRNELRVEWALRVELRVQWSVCREPVPQVKRACIRPSLNREETFSTLTRSNYHHHFNSVLRVISEFLTSRASVTDDQCSAVRASALASRVV